jgi:hypothetical protein
MAGTIRNILAVRLLGHRQICPTGQTVNLGLLDPIAWHRPRMRIEEA